MRSDRLPSPSHAGERPALAAVLLLAGALILFALLLRPAAVSAQSGAQGYWQHTASGRLEYAQLADATVNGVDEIVLADRNGQITLLDAAGQAQWTYDSGAPVRALASLNIVGDADGPGEVALATDSALTLLNADGELLWQAPLAGSSRPRLITGYDYDNDGDQDLLLMLASGQLLAFDEAGGLIWQFAGQEDPTADVDPRLLVSDLDNDGVEEIVLASFTPRRFSQLLLIDNGTVEWRQSVSRRVVALSELSSATGRNRIALATNFGQLNVYDLDGVLDWFRTVNVPITALANAEVDGAPGLLVGTEAGSVIAFTDEGRRAWTNHLAREADRAVVGLLAAPGQLPSRQPRVGAILESGPGSAGLADVLLLGANGQTLAKLGETDIPGITRLTDINHDNHAELLLGRFASLQLIGLGTGSSEYIEAWDYSLEAAPTASLQIDLDRDGELEFLVGTQDGRLHALDGNREIRWLHAPGDTITHLAPLGNTLSANPAVIATRMQNQTDETAAVDAPVSWIELREGTGERLWETVLLEDITVVIGDDGSLGEEPLVLAGTRSGQVVAFNMSGAIQWRYLFPQLPQGITHLVSVDGGPNRPAQLLVAGGDQLYALGLADGSPSATRLAAFDAGIVDLFSMNQPGLTDLSGALVVFTEDGQAHGLNWQGGETERWPWLRELVGPPVLVRSSLANSIEVFQENLTAFLIATTGDELQQLTISGGAPFTSWTLDGVPGVRAFNWEDLDKDGRPDIGLIGLQNGRVLLMDQLQSSEPRQRHQFALASGVFDVALLKRASSQSPDLLSVTQNGLVRLFREEENRPPLLANPQVEADPGQYAISVDVLDVEGDQVSIQLEMFNPETAEWEAQPEQVLEEGSGRLFWPTVGLPAGSEQAAYRFRFDDGFYTGYLTPPEGPIVPTSPPLNNALPLLAATVGAALVVATLIYLRQSQSPAALASRFYRSLQQADSSVLPLVEAMYAQVGGSPDFLLQLANRARTAGDTSTASLADGMFLLAGRPQAGLPIIIRSLEENTENGHEPAAVDQRRRVYRTSLALLEAPSVTELSLLRPQLVQLLGDPADEDGWSTALGSLLPIVGNLRDSERVDSVHDRLVYLNQAALRLRQIQEQLSEYGPSIDRTLAQGLARRWSGLLSAEIEDQRGRAELDIALRTKRLVPNGKAHIAIDIKNNGRAAAENILAQLAEDPAYGVHGPPQTIAFLPPGRTRQVQFLIEPKVEDRFRVAMSLSYDDRSRRNRQQAFGDMVHLLPPVREFEPITNPYLPGTPLRRESALFYGREELFDFVTENAGRQLQNSALILVGQRRTGKTSALLRLDERLPDHLFPVYIDCQSLGVSPGMPALLQEFAWHIADTLQKHGLKCDVPEPAAWQDDPARVFERRFLPGALALLPPATTLLLVFDEFEAFEAMVSDGILPRTFFTYLRHLMQHSQGLSFMFVGTRRLEEMSADYWSVLFNIALYKKIDYLSDEAATRLITEPAAPQILYDDLAIDKILRVTAGHPYFLQLVCYTLVKRANQLRTGYITITDVNAALEEMLRLGEVHFAYLWQRSSLEERALLTAAAHLMDRNEPLHPHELVAYLQPYGIELDPRLVTLALNNLVEREIMREINEDGKTLYALRIELVGLWVASNKSLSRLHLNLSG